MPTRRLPAQPNLAHLKNQAKDLLKAHAARDMQALQRLREFHPRMRFLNDDDIARISLRLSDAQLAIAREYGFPSWPKLKAFVEHGDARVLELPAHERITDAAFRDAVDLMDRGDVEALRAHLRSRPDLVNQRVSLLGGNYFQHPALLEFIAENPQRRGTLPNNAADIARVLLEAGAGNDREALNSALDLVASSAVAHKGNVQNAIIDVLIAHGANPNSALLSPLLYGEFDAVNHLLERGAEVTLVAAAALGRVTDVRRLVGASEDEERRLALSLAAQHGRTDAARALLEAGVKPNGFTPPQGHSHATPLHQAALAGHADIVELLLDAGADPTVRDIHFNATPADWAQHNGHEQLAARLRSV